MESSSLNPGAPVSVVGELDGTWEALSNRCSWVELSEESAEVCWTALTVSCPVTMSFLLSEAGFRLGGQKVQGLGVSQSQYWTLLFPFAIDGSGGVPVTSFFLFNELGRGHVWKLLLT